MLALAFARGDCSKGYAFGGFAGSPVLRLGSPSNISAHRSAARITRVAEIHGNRGILTIAHSLGPRGGNGT